MKVEILITFYWKHMGDMLRELALTADQRQTSLFNA